MQQLRLQACELELLSEILLFVSGVLGCVSEVGRCLFGLFQGLLVLFLFLPRFFDVALYGIDLLGILPGAAIFLFELCQDLLLFFELRLRLLDGFV